ncbi:MAG: hypothetical protein OER83_01040 [Flavobacteriaceae bacterium]|nr:hypothetical protein [Flavobacteriaceae bacterium]MDH3795436.1 hypothetical protein [Flavobacteriaceae bacterium]
METSMIIVILFGISASALLFSIYANVVLIKKLKRTSGTELPGELKNYEGVTNPIAINRYKEKINTNAVHSLTTGCSINHNYST